MSDRIEMVEWQPRMPDEAATKDHHDDLSRTSEESAVVHYMDVGDSARRERQDSSREVNRWLGPLPLCVSFELHRIQSLYRLSPEYVRDLLTFHRR
jgi:hypothetical protein